MSQVEAMQAKLAEIDTATNEIAADLQKLKDQIAGGLSAEEAATISAGLDEKIARLNALGAAQ